MPFTHLNVDLINFSPKYVPSVKICKCVYHHLILISSILRSALPSSTGGTGEERKHILSCLLQCEQRWTETTVKADTSKIFLAFHSLEKRQPTQMFSLFFSRFSNNSALLI